MAARFFGIVGALLLATLIAYASRYWVFDLWPREGLFGIQGLPPQGDLVRRFLGGTIWSPFDIVIWAIAAFLLLSFVQAVADRFK
jgi:hypothetical protein